MGQLESSPASAGSGPLSNSVGSNSVGSDAVGSDVVGAAENEQPAGAPPLSGAASEPVQPVEQLGLPQLGGGLVSSTATHDFGMLEAMVGVAQFDWVIENVTDLPLEPRLPTITNSGEFQITNRCTERLEPHTSCVVAVEFAPLRTGPRSVTLHLLGSDGSDLALTLSGSAGLRVSVALSGQASGEIISEPPGISCGATCSGVFDGNSVRLEARTTNGSGALFAGWSVPECAGVDRVCNLPLSSARSVAATFSPMPGNLVFVSSVGVRTDLGSLAAYDRVCNQLASDAGINDAPGTAFIAGMVNSTTDLRTRLASVPTGWVRLDGRPFATGVAALLDRGEVLYPIRYSERGKDEAPTPENPETYVMTGANADGTASSFTCSDWSDATSASQAEVGYPTGGTTAWSTTVPLGCGVLPLRIACFGRNRTEPVEVPTFAGQRIWLSNTPFVPGSATPDAHCTAESPAGVGAAVALLPYSNRPAAAALNPNANYVRTDGQLVGTGQQIIDRDVLTGSWIHADGTLERQPLARVWTGDRVFTQPVPLAQTCDDWTNPEGEGFFGYPQFLDFFYGAGVPQPCSNTFHYLYCVER